MNKQLEFYEQEILDRLISLTMCIESAIAQWKKDASSKELKELLDSCLDKSEFMEGIVS